jgi:heme/copper-type cytochrome/quinol oxidase subunit 3
VAVPAGGSEDHDAAVRDAEAEAEEHIHMPDPSYWPLVMTAGMLPIGYGLLYASPAGDHRRAVDARSACSAGSSSRSPRATTTSPGPPRPTDPTTTRSRRTGDRPRRGRHDVSAGAHETTLGLDHRKLAMWVFLGSEFLFFGAFIAAYLLYLDTTAGGPGVEIFDIPFTTVSSFVLLMSSLTMVLAHHAHTKGDMRRMRMWILATAGQGAVFLGGQVFEFTCSSRGPGVRRQPLRLGLLRADRLPRHPRVRRHHPAARPVLLSLTGKVKPTQPLKTEMIGLYWHFVDIIWVLIFGVVYLIPELALVGPRAAGRPRARQGAPMSATQTRTAGGRGARRARPPPDALGTTSGSR